MPADVPDDESALRFLSLYFPTGDVSGDFFSVFAVGERAAGVFICDVMGHGVRSALITSMIRALVEEHALITSDPGELLTGSTTRWPKSFSRRTRRCLPPAFISSLM